MATYLGHQEDSSGNILLPTPHSMATQIEFGTKASQAYAKGAYVVFNNRLCKASKAIASGDTLAIGTNLVQCSIGSELNSHLQAPNGNEFYFDYKDGKPGFYPSASKVASEFVPFGGSLSLITSGKANANVVYTTTKSYSSLYVIASDSNIGGFVNTVVNVTANDGTVTKLLGENNKRTNDGIGHGCSLAIYEISGIASGKAITIAPITSGYAVIIYAILA